ncbi:MAG TPA: hypothetical protein DCZ94_12470 [Lentisphaeria bacterium]|nr:MAG: hypothetical protein A2X48_03920 [Lentisphaerae bacterium GWF2_49_21]HBC87761.1 hypothetical protein [Lentisphaeria bacterium]
MSRNNKIILCVVLSFVAFASVAIVIGIQQFRKEMHKGFMNPLIYESPSPSQMGKAMFVTQGFQDRGMHLYISDNKARQENIDVGEIFWSHTKATRATWSKDGSIIACENDIGNHEYFSYVYDFQKDILYYPPGISWCSAEYNLSEEAWAEHSQKMKLLIDERGGRTKDIDLNLIYGNGRAPSTKEWEELNKLYKPFETKSNR